MTAPDSYPRTGTLPIDRAAAETSAAEDAPARAALLRVLAREHGEGLDPERVEVKRWSPPTMRRPSWRRRFLVLRLDRSPIYVAKLPASSSDHAVARERTVVRRLAGTGFAAAENLLEVDGGFVMRYLPSHDLPDVLASDPRPEAWYDAVMAVVDAMARFHAGGPADADPEEVCRELLEPGARPPGPAATQVLAHTPTGSMHGDLGPWNVRADASSGQMAFLDWEDYRHDGIQAFDLLNFLFTLPLIASPGTAATDHAALYDGVVLRDGPLGELLAAGLCRWARLTGAPAPDLLELVPLYCAAMIARLRRQGRSPAGMFYPILAERFDVRRVAWRHRLVP